MDNPQNVMIVTGAGQISLAITRRMGCGKKIILGDKRIENANAVAAPASTPLRRGSS